MASCSAPSLLSHSTSSCSPFSNWSAGTSRRTQHLGLEREILALDFPPEDHARYDRLSEKASEGTLSDADQADLEEYLDVNDVLTVLKLKARNSLRAAE